MWFPKHTIGDKMQKCVFQKAKNANFFPKKLVASFNFWFAFWLVQQKFKPLKYSQT